MSTNNINPAQPFGQQSYGQLSSSSTAVALALADRGVPVLPVCWPTPDGECGCGRRHQGKEIGKAPLTKHGWHDATGETATITTWWSQWPKANVAVALGPAGLLAIDCDSKDAIQEVVELRLPDTPAAGHLVVIHCYVM